MVQVRSSTCNGTTRLVLSWWQQQQHPLRPIPVRGLERIKYNESSFRLTTTKHRHELYTRQPSKLHSVNHVSLFLTFGCPWEGVRRGGGGGGEEFRFCRKGKWFEFFMRFFFLTDSDPHLVAHTGSIANITQRRYTRTTQTTSCHNHQPWTTHHPHTTRTPTPATTPHTPVHQPHLTRPTEAPFYMYHHSRGCWRHTPPCNTLNPHTSPPLRHQLCMASVEQRFSLWTIQTIKMNQALMTTPRRSGESESLSRICRWMC